MDDIQKKVARAVSHFWKTRNKQGRRQGARSGKRDHGNRTVATGGKQLDGFNDLICNLLIDAGIPEEFIFQSGREEVTLPSFFRPTKQWDVVVVAKDVFLASIECKALCGPSFGNNYNNWVEEALGSANDIWTAYREGAFVASPPPFVGYVLLLEDTEKSNTPVKVFEKHFDVFKEFREASYAKRCEESLRRMVRERCYDSAAFLFSKRKPGERGQYSELADDLNFKRFATLMCTQVVGAYESVK